MLRQVKLLDTCYSYLVISYWSFVQTTNGEKLLRFSGYAGDRTSRYFNSDLGRYLHGHHIVSETSYKTVESTGTDNPVSLFYRREQLFMRLGLFCWGLMSRK